MPIPAARPLIGGDERSGGGPRSCGSGMIAGGPEVAGLRAGIRRSIGRRTGNASLSTLAQPALHLGLLAAGVGPGDEVIVPSFTFAATANAVALTGATPVFADIEPATVLPRSRRRRSRQ